MHIGLHYAAFLICVGPSVECIFATMKINQIGKGFIYFIWYLFQMSSLAAFLKVQTDMK